MIKEKSMLKIIFKQITLFVFITMLIVPHTLVKGKIYPDIKPEPYIKEKTIIIDGKPTVIRVFIKEGNTFLRIEDLCKAMNLRYEINYFSNNAESISDGYNMIKSPGEGNGILQFNQKYITLKDGAWVSFHSRSYIALRVFAEGMHYALEVNNGMVSITTNSSKSESNIHPVFGTDFPDLKLNYKYDKLNLGSNVKVDDYNRYVIEHIVKIFVDTQKGFILDNLVGIDKLDIEYTIKDIKKEKEKIETIISSHSDEIDLEILTFAKTALSTLDSYSGVYTDLLEKEGYKPVYADSLTKSIQNFYDGFLAIFDSYVSDYYNITVQEETPVRPYPMVPKMYINDEQVNIQNVNNFPYIKNYPNDDATPEEVYVPLKVVCESVGAKLIKSIETGRLEVEHNGKTTEVVISEMENGVTLVPLTFIGQALGVDVAFESNEIHIRGSVSYKSIGQKLPIENSMKYGSSFEGRWNNEEEYGSRYKKKVIVASKKDLPINIGHLIIYDVYINNQMTVPGVYAEQKAKIYKSYTFKPKETFTVKMKEHTNVGGDPSVYLSCQDGLNRVRGPIRYYEKQKEILLQQKDSNGIITAFYPIIDSGDQFAYRRSGEGKEFEEFTLDDIQYFVFSGDEVLLAIPKSEILR
jgi:hypothetical protein